MSSVSVRATSQPSRFWVIAVTILGVPVLALGLSQITLTVAIAVVATLIVVGVALAMIAARQYAVVAAMCIAVAIFIDWFPILPYPFGGSGIPFAPIIAFGLLGYIVLTTGPSAFTIWPRRLWLWFALFVLTAPAILAGISLQESMNYYGAIFVSPLVFLVLGTVVAQNVGQFRRLLQSLAGLSTFIAVHALIKAFTGIFLFETPYVQKFLETYSDFTFYGTNVSRTGSFLLNPDTTGAFFALVAFLPLGLFVTTRSRVAQALYGIELVLILVALLETYAVGPILAFCVGMLVFIILTMRGNRGIRVTIFVCLVATVLYVALPTQINVLLAHATQTSEVALRVAIWRTTINMMQAYPLSGIGLGSSNYKVLESIFRVSDQTAFEPQAHNSYLEVAVYAGILVGVIFILLVGSALKDAIDAVLKTSVRYRPLLAVVPSMCVALCVYSFVGSGWTCPPLAWMVWLLVGAVASPLLMNSLRKTASPDRHDSVPVDEFVDRTESGSWKWRKRQHKHRLANATRPLSAHENVRRTEMSDSAFLVSQRPQNAFAAPRGLADEIYEDVQIDMMSTAILPYVSVPETEPWQVSTAVQVSVAAPQRREDQISPVMKLLKDSGVYALASLVSPLVSLVLAPILTRHLTLAEYGTLALLNTGVALMQYVTQLGLGPALVRAYNYEHSSPQDRRDVIGVSFILMSLVSIPIIGILIVAAPVVSVTFLHARSLGNIVAIAAIGLLIQNLSQPGLAWLLAESRKFTYSLVSIINVLVVLCANLLFVVILNRGIQGAVLAAASGNAAVALILVPMFLRHAAFHLRRDIVVGLLEVGLPYVPGFASGWILQLADRYLLSILGSVQQVASYSIGYTLGWALTAVLVSPFVSAWGSRMYAIAQRSDALDVFRTVFRIYSLVLLFASFGLAIIGPLVLALLFPAPYQSAAPVIAIVAEASVVYGPYYVFMIGAHVRKKLWLIPIYMGASALVNVVLNLMLIPRLGATGAALSTLAAYGVLACLAYVGNQVIYPVPFEIGRIVTAALIGVVLYLGITQAAALLPAMWVWPLRASTFVCYGLILFGFAGGYGGDGVWRAEFGRGKFGGTAFVTRSNTFNRDTKRHISNWVARMHA